MAHKVLQFDQNCESDTTVIIAWKTQLWVILRQEQKRSWKVGLLLKEFLMPCKDSLPLCINHGQQPINGMINIYSDHCHHAGCQRECKVLLLGTIHSHIPTGCQNPRLKLHPGLQTRRQAGDGHGILLTPPEGFPRAAATRGGSSPQLPKGPVQMAR